MAATDDGVEHHAVADGKVRHLAADRLDLADRFMADDARIARERIVPAIDVYVGAANPGSRDAHQDFVRVPARAARPASTTDGSVPEY